MLAFIVPVKSKVVSSDWSTVSNLLNRCLDSICNQTNPDFKIVISCHEIPETRFTNDPRIEFLQVDFEPPMLKKDAGDRWIKEADKGKKIKLATDYAKNRGAKYIMTVDADDCISNKICDYVHKNAKDSISGWYVKKGYLYPEGKKYSFLNLKNFNTLCGSCVIMKPELIDLMYGENHWFDHERTHFDNGLCLLPLPFPGALYSMLNGTNHVLDRQEMKNRTRLNLFSLKSIQTLFRRLGKYIIVPTAIIRKEFAMSIKESALKNSFQVVENKEVISVHKA